ncbi:DUF4307 domain-containing protein [Marmoricola sp. RAF53]|uniref:DUF4307 domain-containing protein n=1 Tax=Marmoricola sp. RAF53 TaxID=3233059 RepID=UPI003F9AD022
MSDLLQERYGAAKPGRRLAVIVASTLLAVAFLAWLAWAAWFHSSPALDAELTAYDVTGTHEVKVKVVPQVRDDQVRGTCLVRATAADHTIVGELNLTVADLQEQQGHWIPLRTERRATTVELVRCTTTSS